MELSVATVIKYHPSATVTKSTILDAAGVEQSEAVYKMKTLPDHYLLRPLPKTTEGLLPATS